MGKIEVMSCCLVGTTRNMASSMSRLELTIWDLRLLRTSCIQRGLIFHNPQSQQPLINHLKNSLSRTLDLFPPLAGRLATTAHDCNMSRFFVDCNNAGAEFSHAVAAAVSVSDILEPYYTPEIVSSFFPLNGLCNFDGVSTPLLGVRVTELADGVFIGCTANHAVVDGTSFWHFINSWSQISRGFDTISNPPVFERWFPSSAAGDNRLIHLPTLEQNLFAPSPAPQKVFHFSKESVAKLKVKANSEATTDKISTLQAVLAHLWRSIIRCRRRSHSHSQRSEEARIMMAVGARARLSLPEGYFGNAAYLATMAIGEGELLQKGLGYVALKISELVSEQTNEAIIRDAEEKVEYPTLLGGAMGGLPPLIIGSSPRHDVYGNDFGWGKPIAVRSGKAQKHDGLVVVLPATEGGGIDVEVCLAQEALQAMEHDADFMGGFTTELDPAQSL